VNVKTHNIKCIRELLSGKSEKTNGYTFLRELDIPPIKIKIIRYKLKSNDKT